MSVDVSVCLPVCLDSRMVTCNVGGRSAGRSEFRTDRWISRVDGWVDRLLRYQIGFFFFSLLGWLAWLRFNFRGCIISSYFVMDATDCLSTTNPNPFTIRFSRSLFYFGRFFCTKSIQFNPIPFHFFYSSCLRVACDCAWLSRVKFIGRTGIDRYGDGEVG